ncbi:MAG: response regulator transcription factor [Ignavibacteria bacterium]|nr:response regulator transcription factor [Ignavibacteria bacterium]MBL7990332.1 response regulator transcription factor [Candidatus Kapabacteria bacterium]
MKAVIIEDEPLVAKDLRHLLNQIDAGIEILSVLDSLESAEAWFLANPEPDVLFCDIQLSDGVSFDLFKRIEVACPVIFTTAYDEYALRAFKLNSLDYLLKPIDREELEAALSKFQRWKSQNIALDVPSQLTGLLRDLLPQAQKRFKERFLVHGKGTMLLIPAKEAAIFQKEEVIFLTTLDGKRFLTDYTTMEELEELVNPAEFFRANRQTLLHISAIAGFRSDYTGKLHVSLKNIPNIIVDISREKASAFKRWLG